MLVPPHFLVSTAFKKMRWKYEFRKWLPKLPNMNFFSVVVYIRYFRIGYNITFSFYNGL